MYLSQLYQLSLRSDNYVCNFWLKCLTFSLHSGLLEGREHDCLTATNPMTGTCMVTNKYIYYCVVVNVSLLNVEKRTLRGNGAQSLAWLVVRLGLPPTAPDESSPGYSQFQSLFLLNQASLVAEDGKESACNAGDPGSIPWSGRCPGEEYHLLQYSCQESSMYRGAWHAQPVGSQRVGHDWATNPSFSLELGVCEHLL